MKRRRFLRNASLLLAGGVISACDTSSNTTAIQRTDISLPPFSSDNLHRLLEQLRLAFESRSLNVSDTLLPPRSENEILMGSEWFPGEMVPELISLYSWRGGQEPGPWDLTDGNDPFWFRDCAFSSLAIAEEEYQSMMASYGQIREYRDVLRTCFPFAAFNGGWLVIPTKAHNFDAGLARPVVSVMEGIDVFFYSIETMVQTCVGWVTHPDYSEDEGLPSDVELEIWRKYNPGIFGG